MTNLNQLNLFPELNKKNQNISYNRNDVRTGECGVYLTLGVLQSWNLNAFSSESGSEYDIIVDHRNHMIKIQVKARRKEASNLNFRFTRGYHGSKTGVYEYSKNDFDIAACVNISDRKVLFTFGVHRNINWKRKQFILQDAEIASWEKAFNDYVENKMKMKETLQ
tara:strand:+ start:85 stop:579 length:495 start_codon:yes stop_codon:yes gene_type:complete